MAHHKSNIRIAGRSALLLGAVSIFVAALGIFYFVPNTWQVGQVSAEEVVGEKKAEIVPTVTHIKTPSPLYGIYMSQCVVGTPSFREKLVKLIDDTALNAVVIDIKDYSGKISFTTDNPVLAHSVSDKCGAHDMKDFIQTLHDKNIYVIGRITVFQDPYYTKLHPDQAVKSASISPGNPWKDHKGLSFIDVSSRPYWDYVVELSKVAHNEFGFDELNYDYIRYPSDGPMSDARYINPNKAEAVEIFWAYLADKVRPMGVVMSADLFGMTTTNSDDLNIGQQLERALPHFDYIMPMVYPSHYPKNFRDLGNPNNNPYEVIRISMSAAAERAVATTTLVRTLTGIAVASTSPQLYTKDVYAASKLRPWLQDFDYGKDYTEADIAAQIKGNTDSGLTSWIFWDPANRYENLARYLRSAQVAGQ